MRALVLFAALLTIAFFPACSPQKEGAPPSLGPGEAQAWLRKDPSVQLVDVRTREEYAEGHLAGAQLLPVQELESRMGEIDREKPVLLYCRSGRRSRQAFDLLKEKGFQDLHDMTGGIEAWKKEGLPVEGGR
jgi:rhodanese-related sulfurtransferase